MSYINEVHPVDYASSSSTGYTPRPGGCTCFLQGSGPPGQSLGQRGDAYLDNDNYVLYAPKSAAGWGQGYALRGPPGVFLSGFGPPDSSLGDDGSTYLDLTPGKVSLYANKQNGTWPSAVLLSGAPGPSGRDGTRFVFGDGPPPTQNENIGPYDCWVDQLTGTLYPQLQNEA